MGREGWRGDVHRAWREMEGRGQDGAGRAKLGSYTSFTQKSKSVAREGGSGGSDEPPSLLTVAMN